MESFDKLKRVIESFKRKNFTEEDIDRSLTLLDSIHDYTKTLAEEIVRYINVDDLDPIWVKVGCGHFGHVYASKYEKSKVAIKILNEGSRSRRSEGGLLYSLSHENIIAFRGLGYITHTKAKELNLQVRKTNMVEMMFLVMEYIDQNLFKYVEGMKVHEIKGLSDDMVWDIGQQIIRALNYLHNKNIAHHDLKPDNILVEVGPRRVIVKLTDFGLSNAGHQINTNHLSESSISSVVGVANKIWDAPEVFQVRLGCELSLEDYKKADIYCFGNVLTFMLTGEQPCEKISTKTLALSLDLTEKIADLDLPKNLTGHLNDLIFNCRRVDPKYRPTAKNILDFFFCLEKNLHLMQANQKTEADFFSCGFLDKTDIFVADSCTNKEASQIGFYESEMRPTGYDHSDLKCLVEVEKLAYRDIPDQWTLEAEYKDNLETFQETDKHQTVALKGLSFARTGEKENQLIDLIFKQSDSVHYMSMKKIWKDFSSHQKIEELPSKADVHPYFSNTFDLHVAVLTNEGPDNPQKIVFPPCEQRDDRTEPGIISCGAFESASHLDYNVQNGKTYVDLVNTAARGLKEKLGLELLGSDLNAICLTTVFLKFDTHEWGLCGFVDLKDERINLKHRMSADSLKDIFSIRPKFKHQTLTFVDFDLKSIVEFVFNNHEHFESSDKLVVVKVLQAFYGWQLVQKEFEILRYRK
ncbi:uncharacterized protein LOC143082974 [Mytilus galloprovincialis]|uniref:uncharacterized protein LOC143082974 n=1 Tax=Mytilus galloprovincialis TaxID=29158 RepID=UPI003F7B44BE